MNKNINSIEKLYFKTLLKYNPNNSIRSVHKLLKNYNGNDWQKYVAFNKKKYKRICLKQFSSPYFEFILICWKKGQNAPIHNHPKKGCLVKILKGQLKEIYYDHNLIQTNQSIYSDNSVSYLDDTIGYHEIIPLEDTISLHIYAPPNYKPRFFKKLR
jgi:predicted metal-dependent enzyme (double-stranded beta helix superfamily)